MCITRLHQVLVESDNKRSFTIVGVNPEHFLVSVFPTSEKFDSDLELDAGMHKIDAHPCPPKTHGYGWAWVWVPNIGLYHTGTRLPSKPYLQGRHILKYDLKIE